MTIAGAFWNHAAFSHAPAQPSTNLNVEKVTTIDRVLDESTSYRYAWDYHSSENHTAVCANHGDFSTEVTDPNAHVATYCYKPREEDDGKAKEWVYDGEKRERTENFNIDRQSEAVTHGASGTTVKSYGLSLPDQLMTVKAPDSGGTTGERTNISYDHVHDGGGENEPKGGDYIPASVTDPNGGCTRYEYRQGGPGDRGDHHAPRLRHRPVLLR